MRTKDATFSPAGVFRRFLNLIAEIDEFKGACKQLVNHVVATDANVEQLVRSKQLQQNGMGKGTWYSLPLG